MVSLVVPGSSERMLAKARGIEVDELVIDPEDAVIPERRSEVLTAVLQALVAAGFKAGRVLVRINAIGTAWAYQELIALGAATARGLAALDQIVAASPRLDAIILGYADVSVSLGRSRAAMDDLDRWLAVQDAVLVAARAAGVRAIDGPFLKLGDPGLLAAARRAADLGFDGKWAIHPSQLQPIAAEFTPSAAEVAHAESVLEALARTAQDGGGAVAMDGEMLDEPVRLAALRMLARASRVSEPAR